MKYYNEVDGDLLDRALNGEFDVIIHGCNCFNTMGAGIAGQIAKRFPSAYAQDRLTVPGDTSKLGNFTITSHKNDFGGSFFIINAYTQYHPGRKFEIKFLKEVLRKVHNFFPGSRIGIPLIGCGIGGGHWPEVRRVIKRRLVDSSRGIHVTVVRYAE